MIDLRDDDPMKEATSLRSVINLYATRFQNVVSAQRNLGFKENQDFKASYEWPCAQLSIG
ncbi:hypothetical protein [Bradyrhizobium sp. 195]|uniref:hypothetical protein n=1 Tax=Bradyrhizobium sp. 195 TaxID=2782662 RepID=UPI002001541C|nr:hypothetical protein [Bradyrhizobium sp. 195]UPK28110.1 hypothetical protein IVB26_05945 [Bradyrhizobium sp. 195]